MSVISSPSETQKESQEKLVTFCQLLAQTYRQLRALTSTERSNVDKTLAKASRYELIRRVNYSATSSCYSERQIEQTQTECLHEINNRLIATGELIHETTNEFYKLLRSYQDLQQTAQKLDWSTTSKCALINGGVKQKPLEYYIQEGHRIVYQLSAVTTRIKLVFGAVDFQRADTIQKLRDCLKLSEELDLYLREFMVYSSFIVK
ncbi:uncharacterized protein LOC134216440 [Armigeres subalbatus]|uniref:uncharacterized protein LOC134216440 n=1 Tax=Armigeres subalbatus TaxID=124917 RepID=UPI002ED62F0F